MTWKTGDRRASPFRIEQDGITQPYDVVAFDKQGVRVFNSYR